jgi:MFS family permease
VTPFVGQLSDLFGRRNLALGAAVLLLVGDIICATAQTMNNFICGMVLIGVGAGILELTALAVAGEMAPAKSRGIYVGAVILSVLPFAPSVLYAQFIAVHGSWRWIGLLLGGVTVVGIILTAFFFFPPPPKKSEGFSKKQTLARVDFVGGFLSIVGLTLFLAGLTWGAGLYSWTSAHTLVPLITGGFFILAFVAWEIYGAAYPMFPAELKRNPRAFATVLVITATSGAAFFTVLVDWPSQYTSMYADNNDPVSVGLGSLPIAFSFLGGSVVVLVLMSYFRSYIRAILIVSSIIMTAGKLADPHASKNTAHDHSTGNGALAAATVDDLQAMFAPLVLVCFGCGAVIVPCQVIASVVCPDELIATVFALTISVRIVGGALGYAIYYTILTDKFAQAAVKYVATAAIEAGVQDPEKIKQVMVLVASSARQELMKYVDTPMQVDALVLAGREAYAASYQFVYLASIAFGSLAIIAACILPDVSSLMDAHVAAEYV